MIKRIVGGVVTLVIGGTAYTVSQTSVVNNFSKNTGMTQQQAQNYVHNAQNNLQSFSKIGQSFVSDGNTILGEANQIDCNNYSYTWQTDTLGCTDGQNELQTIGNDEVTLGNCYISLGSDLGSASQSEINDCVNDIDSVNSDYNLPIATQLISSSDLSANKDTNIYNKSVLQAALQSSNGN